MSSTQRRKISEIWLFYDQVDEFFAKCNLCKRVFSYKTSITNLKKHLECKHPTVSIPSSSTSTARRDSTSSNSQQSESQPATQNQRVVPITTYMNRPLNESKKTTLDSKLMLLFTKSLQPFKLVEEQAFCDFIHELNPSYQLPSRHFISRTMLPALFEKCRLRVKELLTEAKRICITTDCWTSINNEAYIAVTAHYVDDKFNLKSLLLECKNLPGNHTSANLAECLDTVVTDWNIKEKVLLGISDNAYNIVNAMETRLKWNHFGCLAHTLNLIVNAGLKCDDNIVSIIEKVKKIVAFFKRSTTSSAKFLTYQRNNGNNNPLKLLQDIPTRWNSTFYMLERFIQLEEAVKATTALLSTNLPILEQKEWQILKELVQILKPFESATKIFSGDTYGTAAIVIPVVNGLTDICAKLLQKDLSDCIKKVLQIFQSGIKNRLEKVHENRILCGASFCDPRFKLHAFTNQTAQGLVKEQMISAVTDMIVKVSNSNEGTQDQNIRINSSEEVNDDELSVWSAFDKNTSDKAVPQETSSTSTRAIIEIERFLECGLIPRNEDPLKWWRINGYQYPYLKRVAQEKLSALCTSVPCERVFSKAGLVITDKRSRLSTTKANMILFLNVNGIHL
nr:zinc finger BED domain-containing protein 1-like [Onthophagus taurus]